MGKKHLQASLISKKSILPRPTARYINKNPSLMEGWSVDGDEAQVLVSIRFLQYSHQCFSDWQKQEMKAFWSFIDSIHNQTWAQVYNTSGKSGKTGLAYTKTKLDSYPNSDFKKGLDPQITMFELRIDNVKRVHGFRHKSIFYICWLDKGHTIFP